MATDPNNWMWTEACSVLDRMEHMHRQFFRAGVGGTQAGTWQPPIDVFETGDSLWIAVALPGVENQDIEITIEHDVLVISGARHLPTLPRGVAIHRLEIPYGRFERQVQLPSGQFELTRPDIMDGCLFITLAKR
jgi:HSP20 family molecular chaperone IbpA